MAREEKSQNEKSEKSLLWEVDIERCRKDYEAVPALAGLDPATIVAVGFDGFVDEIVEAVDQRIL